MNFDAYYCLHYGREWFEWSLRMIYPFTRHIYAFYSDHPSHGQSTRRTCPETRDELRAIAAAFNVIWIDMPADVLYEGQHRDLAVEFCQEHGADVLLAIDADEIWDQIDLATTLDQVESLDARIVRCRVKQHLWKGVNWACHDESMPVRFFNFNSANTIQDGYLSTPGFYHMGYAQSLNIVSYKMAIHGHRNELKHNWVAMFANWKGPEDTPPDGVHPTCGNDDRTGKPFWTPAPFDRMEIEHLIGDHPYFSDELV